MYFAELVVARGSQLHIKQQKNAEEAMPEQQAKALAVMQPLRATAAAQPQTPPAARPPAGEVRTA